MRFVAVMIDALSVENVAYDERWGFLAVPGTTNKLYMPATTLLEVVDAR